MKRKQIWKKNKLLVKPSDDTSRMKTHMALPVCEKLGEPYRYRVYFSSRDRRGRSHIGHFDLSIGKSLRVLQVFSKPVLCPGPLGSFDESGVTSSCIVNHNGRKYLYYTGWTLGQTVPFYFYIGVAISEDDGKTFLRFSPSPILERNEIDPYLTASPFVIVEDNLWRMWYVSGVKWVYRNSKPKHYYHIKYAESKDGLRWDRRGVVCIDFKTRQEYAFSRPCVLKDGNLYKMWYSFRGRAYKIGYAESTDGIKWVRKDKQFHMKRDPKGWDSEMRAYPFVFRHEKELVMLYNGNDYGKTGIGFALLPDEG